MSRLEYAKLFFLGKKSNCMIDIERRYPKLEGFSRLRSFFFAFGNLGYDFKGGFVIFLPAICRLEFNLKPFHLNTILFSLYLYQRRQALR